MLEINVCYTCYTNINNISLKLRIITTITPRIMEAMATTILQLEELSVSNNGAERDGVDSYHVLNPISVVTKRIF